MYLKDIFEAIQYGDVLELQRMVQQGADVNGTDKRFQYTVLHWAAHYGAIECMHWLLWHGTDIHRKTKEGWTPVHIAAIKGRTNCVQALAANGGDMNIQDSRGKTVAHLAAAHGHAQTLQEILRKGIDLALKDVMGWTVFHTAGFHGRLGCLQLLVKWDKEKLNELDLTGNTPLHLAASEGHLPCLKFLILSADNIEKLLRACNDHGETARDLATQYLKKKCVSYLDGVAYDLEHPEKSENMAFPAHNSAYNGDIEYLQMVIESGVASIDERDERGSTPVHKAAGNGQVEVLKWLIEKGANVHLMNGNGETAKDVAMRYGQVGCLRILGGESDVEDDETENDIVPDEPQIKAEAKGRAERKINELAEQLEVAKLNFQQLGGVLEEEKRRVKEETEHQRIIRDLEGTLKYERVKREKLESQLDELRLQLHRANLELERANDKIQYYQDICQQKPQSAVTKAKPKTKKKKKIRPNQQTGVISIQRPISNLIPKPPSDLLHKRPSSAKLNSNTQMAPVPPNRPRTASRHKHPPPVDVSILSDSEENRTDSAGGSEKESSVVDGKKVNKEKSSQQDFSAEEEEEFEADLESVASHSKDGFDNVVLPSKETDKDSNHSFRSNNGFENVASPSKETDKDSNHSAHSMISLRSSTNSNR